ncbi:Retrovirus-related Pol polyprotein from transposon 17.6 [Vitis vinifera]|uniref:Retrovirus-related Pol polyprotein from transposon 17.6 n=1 Tax=Vitis vinifera TaxID=29760 RepID=A0A438FNZ9_VITVI|nr:Retrovirus-related Pol polyprotein from transposon 17.6 [Vitis vinifera]
MEATPEDQHSHHGHQDNPNEFRSMRDRMHPPRMSAPSCIVPPTEQLVIRPILFHFYQLSMDGKPRSIRTWTDLQAEFLKKFFPTHRTNGLKRQISNFSAKENEKFYECWERYMEAINACPHHGFDTWLLVSYFYDGMSSSMKQLLEQCVEGFHERSGKDEVSTKCFHAKAGMYTLNEDVDMKAKFAAMTRRLEELELKKMHEVQAVAETPVQVKPCSICQSYEHLVEECPTIPVAREMFGDQANVIGQFKPNSNASYGILTTQVGGIIQIFHGSQEHLSTNSRSTISTSQQASSLEQAIVNLSKIDNLQYSISRLTNLNTVQEKGRFPSQPHQNPKGIHEVETHEGESSQVRDVKALITLRSGKKVESPTPKPHVEEEEERQRRGGNERKEERYHKCIIQCKSPLKYKDPGCPTISVMIGGKLITPEEEEGPEEVCIIDTLVEEHCNQNMQDKLNESLGDLEEGLLNPLMCLLLYKVGGGKKRFYLYSIKRRHKMLKEIPKLNLKPLPMELKYTYLEENNNACCYIFISYYHQEISLLEVLKRCKKAIGWQISDLKGSVLCPWVSPTQVVPKKSGITVVQNEKGEEIATRLTSVLGESLWPSFLLFLGRVLRVFQIEIDVEDQEKTTFTCPFGTYAYRRMPFGLCNAPATFQRCMLSIFSDMVERIMEVFMDDITIYGGIVLGHIISEKGIEVDKAKVELIVKLPSPTLCQKSFDQLKQFLTTAPIVRAPNWQLPFEVMCDASDFAIGAVLGQREDGKPYVIYYASKIERSSKELHNYRERIVSCGVCLRQVSCLFEFDLQIRDKKGVENVVADHLSRLAIAHNSHVLPINDDFPEESLMLLEKTPWYAHIANYLLLVKFQVSGKHKTGSTSLQRFMLIIGKSLSFSSIVQINHKEVCP